MGVFSRLFPLTLIIFLAAACQTEEILPSIESANFPGAGSSDYPPGRWSESAMPLDIKVSESFAAQERDMIIERMNSWEDSINNYFNFFTDEVAVIENFEPDSLAIHHQLNDDAYPEANNIGIYLTNKFHPELTDFTIAIAYSVGRRASDSRGPYIEMEHSDIILNDRDFDFSLNPSGPEFDLESVIVHELGHLLGMNHETRNVESVMLASIWFGIIRREPSNEDSEVLRANYRINSTANAFSAGLSAGNNNRDGERVVIIQKLKADGECEHYMNGTHLFTH